MFHNLFKLLFKMCPETDKPDVDPSSLLFPLIMSFLSPPFESFLSSQGQEKGISHKVV